MKRHLHSGKLTWHWKIHHLKIYFLLEKVNFHCYVSLLEGISQLALEGLGISKSLQKGTFHGFGVQTNHFTVEVIWSFSLHGSRAVCLCIWSIWFKIIGAQNWCWLYFNYLNPLIRGPKTAMIIFSHHVTMFRKKTLSKIMLLNTQWITLISLYHT